MAPVVWTRTGWIEPRSEAGVVETRARAGERELGKTSVDEEVDKAGERELGTTSVDEEVEQELGRGN